MASTSTQNDLRDWPALVLTAGLGTRLRPLSLVRAKAALPVGGEAVIRRILRWLERAGVRRVVVNLHHKPETITRRVGDGRDLGLEVRYSWEDRVLGSAGGARRALPLLDADRFLIVNGDTITDVDLRDVARHHEGAGALVTMAVVPGDTDRYGGVIVSQGGIVTGFARGGWRVEDGRPQPGSAPASFHFIGVQAVETRAFADLADGDTVETVRSLYPRLIAQDATSIHAHVGTAEFLDIGTPADYLATTKTITAREGHSLDRGIDIQIATSARIESSILWDRVHVNADVTVANCVLADDVVIPAGARYDGKVIAVVDGQLTMADL